MSNMDPDGTREAWGWVMQAMPTVDELTPEVQQDGADLPIAVVCVDSETEVLRRCAGLGGRSKPGPEGTIVFVMPHARFRAEFPTEGVAAKVAQLGGMQFVAVQGSSTMLFAHVPLQLEERKTLFAKHGWS